MAEVDLSLDTIRRNLNWALGRDDRRALVADLSKALHMVPAPYEPTFLEACVAVSMIFLRRKSLKPFPSPESFEAWIMSGRQDRSASLFGVEPGQRRFEEFRDLNLELLELLARRFVAEPGLDRALDMPLTQTICSTMLSLRNVGVRLPFSKGMADEMWGALHEVARMKCPLPPAATQLRTVINLMRADYPVPDRLAPRLEAFLEGWKDQFLKTVPWWRNDFPPLGI